MSQPEISQPRSTSRWASLAASAKRWQAHALDLVFPPQCAHCQAVLESGLDSLLCADCRHEFVSDRCACPRCAAAAQAGSDGRCGQCRDWKLHFSQVVRLGAYDNDLRRAVLRIKRQQQRALAMALGDLLAHEHAERLAAWKVDAVVPIPMHWSRRMWRGTNSPETIADRLAAALRVPLASHLLSRRRRTAPQANLPPTRRKANVRGAFLARPHADLPGARLLLVDDIMTTGATLNEAARTLVRAGAAEVAVAVLARADGTS